MDYEAVIGLEVHAQLNTRTKIFCGCSTEFGAPPNTHTCPVCLGLPGVLPVLNRTVVDYALRMALATGCSVNPVSRFARKNYFYPDLPKGYQISQYELPLARDGRVDIQVDGRRHAVGINRIHLEEDAGKLVHDPHGPVSRVDLNRTGVPLIEIVSEPDLRTPAQAGAYLRHLRTVLRYLGICDGNMEEGSFRCDANVSIRPAGRPALGTRTELKNLNSFRHVERALAYEIQRQQEVVRDGGAVVQETRLWDPDHGLTQSMRGKEEAHDYRYFPDPDLQPLEVDERWLRAIRDDLPELPAARRARFVEAHDLPAADAELLTGSRELADFFEACLEFIQRPRLVSNWITGELLKLLHARGVDITHSPVAPPALAELLQLLDEGTVSGPSAKAVLEEMAAGGQSARRIVESRGLTQVSDTAAIEAEVAAVLAAHPDQVDQFRQGKTKVLGFFVGQVMRRTRGKANPKMVNDIITDRLRG